MKEKIISILFVIFITGFFIINIISKDILISDTERRKMSQFPDFNFDDVMILLIFQVMRLKLLSRAELKLKRTILWEIWLHKVQLLAA